MKEIIEIDGIRTWFSLHKNSKCNFDEDHFCAVCNKKLESGDSIYFIGNNDRLFPNVWAHVKCVKNHGKYITVTFLRHKWKRYCEISEKYKSFIFYIYDW